MVDLTFLLYIFIYFRLFHAFCHIFNRYFVSIYFTTLTLPQESDPKRRRSAAIVFLTAIDLFILPIATFCILLGRSLVVSHICEHGEKYVQPMHPHFSRLCTYHIGLHGHTKKLQLACAHRL